MSEYQPHYEKSYGLVIGIDTYSDPRFMPLGNAESDAQAIAEILSGEPYGFDVNLLLGEEATKRAVVGALGRLRSTQPDDRIVFYFAGHGYVLSDNWGNDVGYLACADTVPDDPYGGLEFDEVTKIRRFAKAKHIAFILDACFTGAALGLTRGAISPAAASEYLIHRAYQVLTAGAVEVVSDARSMTGELVKVLREGVPGRSGPLTFSHIGQHVHDVIHDQSKGMQSPICQYLEGSGKGQMVLFTPRALDVLPARLRRGLTSQDADTRFLALDRVEKLLPDPCYAGTLREVLREMALNDSDQEVKSRAMDLLLKAERVQTPEPVIEVVEPEPEPELEPPLHDVLDILPPPFEWCEIPSVEGFRLLTDEGDKGTYDIAQFYMAKYPITYAQFQVFVDAADGFYNDEWWQGLAAVKKHKSKPGEQEWPIDNHPRENVSWYDAVAFTRWLSSKLGYEVRLPTEWEWQWAAQGDDGREYPWGNRFAKSKCNTRESGIGQTTPVDKYPTGISPYSVYDMAGNVHEWCLNRHSVPSDVGLGGTTQRVVRGGSWRGLGQFARAVYRDYGCNPDFRDRIYGFRVAGFVPV
jgi:formylglycine-generating enzyme required for sulfatase activity